jgi:hypothetical protein
MSEAERHGRFNKIEDPTKDRTMGILRIHITATDAPLKTVNRRIGATNVGFYCSACGEFIALAVEPDGSTDIIEFIARSPIYVGCPFCQRKEYRHTLNLRRFLLTEASKCREPTPA